MADNEKRAIANVSKAEQMLSKATNIKEVVAAKYLASAANDWFKKTRGHEKEEEQAIEIMWRAQRKAGGFLKDMKDKGELKQGGDKKSNSSKTSLIPTLKDYGISWDESSVWQALANMETEKFEAILAPAIHERKEAIIPAYKDAMRPEKRQAQMEKIKQLIPVKGKYNLIVVDPPWQEFGMKSSVADIRGAGDYPTMTIDEIKKIKLPMADDCIVWLWGIDAYLREALDVLDSWGLKRKGTLIWVKDKIGLGHWLRNKHEYCFLATRGKPGFLGGDISTILEAPRISHSTKPDAFYELVKKLSPYPIGLDYFSRKKREGWDVYGDEVE